VLVSVDTMRAEVAEAALGAGAGVVNDVSGGLADPRILEVVAAAGVPYVAMHWRAHADRMADHTAYPDGVVTGVCAELAARLASIEAAGVDPARVVLDPGLGFAKTQGQNWALLRGLGALEALGRPVLVGASRKSFLGALLAEDGRPRPVDQREAAHVALVVLLARRGTWGVRAHDVRAVRDALTLVERMRGPADDA
jgi:dihydropteroate synthase